MLDFDHLERRSRIFESGGQHFHFDSQADRGLKLRPASANPSSALTVLQGRGQSCSFKKRRNKLVSRLQPAKKQFSVRSFQSAAGSNLSVKLRHRREIE
jgi:hypothetical protein